MKCFFTSIVFCLLLLPGVGSGQGVIINEIETIIYVSHTYEEMQYRPSSLVGIIDTEKTLKANKVKGIVVYEHRKKTNAPKKIYEVRFDSTGRMLFQLRFCQDKNFNISQDSAFVGNKTIVTTKIIKYDSTELASKFNNPPVIIDSIVFEKTKLGYNGSQIMITKRTNTIYRQGETINLRNKNYQSLWYDPFSYGPHLSKHGIATYNFVKLQAPQGLKTNYSKNKIYTCKKQVGFTVESEILGRTLTYKEMRKIPLLKKQVRKSGTQYFIDGEFLCEQIMMPKFYVPKNQRNSPEKQWVITKNNVGLTDTIFCITFGKQKENEPCVKPAFINSEGYLIGFSGVTESKTIEYTFRYEYFNE